VVVPAAHVEFRKRTTLDGSTVDIVIDGRPLTDLAREAELESASLEGKPDLAGKYGGLPWEVVATHLLVGEANGIWSVLEADQGTHRIPLLVCACGEPGCWPLMATFEMVASRIIWRDFHQPHRRDWNHSKLGPFSFERQQYLDALEEALRSPDSPPG
jgi:hypothetical protein